MTELSVKTKLFKHLSFFVMTILIFDSAMSQVICRSFAESNKIKKFYQNKLANLNLGVFTWENKDRFVSFSLHTGFGISQRFGLLERFDSSKVSIRFLDSKLGWRRVTFKEQQNLSLANIKISDMARTVYESIGHLYVFPNTPLKIAQFRELYNSKLASEDQRSLGLRVDSKNVIPLYLRTLGRDGSLQVYFLEKGKIEIETIKDLNILARVELMDKTPIHEKIASLTKFEGVFKSTANIEVEFNPFQSRKATKDDVEFTNEKVKSESQKRQYQNSSNHFKNAETLYSEIHSMGKQAGKVEKTNSWVVNPKSYEQWLTSNPKLDSRFENTNQKKWALYVFQLEQLPPRIKDLKKKYHSYQMKFHPDRLAQDGLSKEVSNEYSQYFQQAFSILKSSY